MNNKITIAAIAMVAVMAIAACGICLFETSADGETYFMEDGIRYMVTDDVEKTVSVVPLETGKYAAAKELVIPATVTHEEVEYKVTGIADETFKNTSGLYGISLPEGLVTIGEDAFYSSAIYQDLVIPSTVTSIGEYAFYKCTITGLDMSATSVKEIKDQTFAYCTALKTVKLNSSLQSIGERAFAGDTAITSLDFGEDSQLKTLADYAFQGAFKGVDVTIPATVTSIGDETFTSAKVKSYTVEDGNTAFESTGGCIIVTESKTLLFYPIANTAESFAIPDGVKALGENSFYSCASLKTLTIDNSVKIGGYSLTMCSNLKTMVIGQTAALPEDYKGIIATYLCADNGYWSISNITLNHIVIDSTYAVDLTGLMGKKGQYVDFTEQSVNTVGGNFTDNGAPVPSADRAGNRYSNVSDAASNEFVYDLTRYVTVVCDPKEGGTVEGAGSVELGKTATLTATPKSGYKFGYWNGDEELTDPTYQFVVNADTEVTATFVMVENCFITVPADVTVEMTMHVGIAPENMNPSSYNYYNFAHVDYTSVVKNDDGTLTYSYILPNESYGLIVSGEGCVTYKDLFTKKSNTEYTRTVTTEMLHPEGKSSTYVDRSVVRSLGDDVGGILVSGNAANYITLDVGDEMPMMVYRHWQAVGNTMQNPFLEPDIQYEIRDFEGKEVTDVISLEKGPDGGTTFIMKALKEGTVIVTMHMDAFTLNVTTDTFFGATWPELTAVMVVTVGESGEFDTGMTITNSISTRPIDCEIDVFYYDHNFIGYNFEFTPAAGTTVTVYNPVLGDNTISNFVEGTAVESEGKWTLTLTEGRNIVKMVNDGKAMYQVLTAMPVIIEINGVDSFKAKVFPGMDATVTFKSTHGDYGGIFNSKGKLAGLYNSNATIYYAYEDGTRVATAKQPAFGHYFFLTAAGYQSLTVSVPADAEGTFTIYPDGIVLGGFDGKGTHRDWFLKSASSLGLVRVSGLPEISVNVATDLTTFTVPTAADMQMTMYTGTAPENMNPSSYNYYNFTHVEPLSVKDNEDGTTTYTYGLLKGKYAAIVSGEGFVTYKDLFEKKDGTEYTRTVTLEMLQPEGKSSTYVDRSVARNLGDDVGGILVSGNKANYITLDVGDEMPMMVYRLWQAVGNTMQNPFLEPDIQFEIRDFEGNAVTDVISLEKGPDGGTTFIMKALKEGTVIVTMHMDAFTLNVTTDTFFGATWPELTAVMVVTVGESGEFDTGMTITNSESTRPVDCEIDVFYYDHNSTGYVFEFTPAAGTTVTVYNPVLGDNTISNFVEGTAVESEGKWTVTLTEGRNIVKMVNDGKEMYQVLTAMPVIIEINGVDISKATVQPGTDATVTFKSTHGDYGGIFNSKGKLAGLYNSNATIFYTYEDGTRVATANQPMYGHYFFLTAAGYQTLTVSVPADAEGTFTIYSDGVKLGGFDGKGTHRDWFLKSEAQLGLVMISGLPDIVLSTAEMTEYTILLDNLVKGEDSSFNGRYTATAETPVKALYKILTENGIPTTITGDEPYIYFQGGMISDWTFSWDTSATDLIGANFGIWVYTEDDGWFLAPNSFGMDDYTTYIICHTNYYTPDGATAKAAGITKTEEGTYTGPVGWDFSGAGYGYVQAAPVGLKSSPEDVLMGNPLYTYIIPDEGVDDAAAIVNAFVEKYKDPIGFKWTVNEGATADLAVITETYTNSSGKEGTKTLTFEKVDNVKEKFVAIGNAMLADIGVNNSMGTWRIFYAHVDDVAVLITWQNRSDRDYTMVKFVMAAGSTIAYGGEDGADNVYFRNTELETTLPMIISEFFLTMAGVFVPEMSEYTIILDNSVDGEDSTINGLYTTYASTPVKALYKILTENGIATTITGDEASIYFKSGMISDWTTSWDSSATDLIGANYGIWAYTSEEGWFLAPNSFGADDFTTYIISHTNYYKPDGATAKAVGITKNEEGAYTGPVGWDYSNTGWGDYSYVQAAPVGLKSAPEDVVMGNELYLVAIPLEGIDDASAIATALVENYDDPIGFTWTVNEGATADLAVVTETYTNTKGEESTRTLTFEKVDNVKEKFVAIGNALLADVGVGTSMGTWKIFYADVDDVALLVIWQHREDRDYCMVKYVMAAGSTISYGGQDGSGAVYFRNTALDTTLPMIIDEFFLTMADVFVPEMTEYTIIIGNMVEGEDSSFNDLYTTTASTPVKALYRILTENGIATTITGNEESIYFTSGMIADWTTGWDITQTDVIGPNYGIWAYTEDDGWFLAPNKFGADDYTVYIIAHVNYYKPDGATAKAAGITKNEEGAYTGPVGWDYSNSGWGEYAYIQAAPIGIKSAPEDVVMGNPLYLITLPAEAVDDAAAIATALVENYKDPIGFKWTVNEGATATLATVTETYTNTSGKESTRTLTFEKADNVKEKFVAIGNALLADVGVGTSMGTWKIIYADVDDVALLVIWQHREDRDYCMVKYVMAAGNSIAYGGEDGTGAVYFRNTELETTLPMIITGFFSTMADAFAPVAGEYTVTYMLDGEIYGAVDKVMSGNTVTVRDKAVKVGYTVSDWTSADVVIENGKFVMPTKNVTITATSKINQYTITFDTEGGTAVPSITADYGAPIVAPQNPIKLGCDFSNWYPAVPATMPAENITIKAVWTQTDKDGNTNVDLTETGSDLFVMPKTASKSADIKVAVKDTAVKQTADIKVENASELSGKTVTVTVDKTAVPPEVKEKNAVAYEFDFKANNVQYNGKMKVTLPYTKESGKDPVVYWANGSTMEKMNIVSSTDDSVTFETDHNSTYVVASAEPASGGSDNTALIIVGVIVAIVVIAAVAFFVVRSRQ